MAKKPFGVLLLHGFPGNNHDFETLEPGLRELGLTYRIPNLRGLGAESPAALAGVTWHDWLADAHTALDGLLQEVEKVVVIGHSMGGAITLMLASESPEHLDSLVLLAAEVQLANPMAPGNPLNFIVPVVRLFLKKWDFPPSPLDGYRRGYPWAPAEATLSMLDLSIAVKRRLAQVRLPALLLQGRKDDAIADRSIDMTYNGLSTPAEQKRVLWFENSTHDLLFDAYSPAVVKAVIDYVRERVTETVHV